jgi:hypothetical protein
MSAITWPDDLEPDSLCPIGKYKGHPMSTIPADTLKWYDDEYIKDTTTKSANFFLMVRYYRKYHKNKKS